VGARRQPVLAIFSLLAGRSIWEQKRPAAKPEVRGKHDYSL
jgi:hypothetical protein